MSVALSSLGAIFSGMALKIHLISARLPAWSVISLSLALAACGGNYTQQISEVTGKTRYLNPAAAQKKNIRD
jgi:hypothetical protein